MKRPGFFHPSGFILHPYSSSAFILHPYSSHAAIAAPPGRLVPTGGHAGPLSPRGLNQNAVTHTLAPGATVAGKMISILVRVMLPSNFQPTSVDGATSPTKLNTLAPSTPGGLPRREGLAASISLTRS